jgi:hypothetical protein
VSLSRDQEEIVREALTALVDTTPPGVAFEDLETPEPMLKPKGLRWPSGPAAFGTAFVLVILIGAVSLLFAGGNGNTGEPLDEPMMSNATPADFDEIENPLLLEAMAPRADDELYSIPAGEFTAFVLIRSGEPPHVFATSCDVLDTVDLPEGWEGTCLEMTVDGVRVTGTFGYHQTLADNTYADEQGFLWYATDCPNADVLLSAESADALPNIETTARDHVEAIAQSSPEYRVIPRNGWVWERTDDGGFRVRQVEDFMLERTIESAEDCPPIPAHATEGVPVAYRITSD